ncbi:FtsX-like permease family protein [Nonomuraea sp. CA-218870]|uniref:FtsX-like permease family protein n=1 Tax=Nonomuraea sp. CA-218870 TaxID=3239998 RepID=UPI003D903CB4
MSATLAALRLARRNARRSPARTTLITIMIGLPVLVITALLTLTATLHITPQEGRTTELGAADARLVRTPPGTTLQQRPHDLAWQTTTPPTTPPPGAPDLTDLLGPGTRTIPYNTGTVHHGAERLTAIETDLRDPLTTGMLPLREGRHPTTGQAAVTPALGLRPGDLLHLAGAPPLTITGIVEHPHRPSLRAAVGPDLPLATPGHSTWNPYSTEASIGWLADTPSPLTWTDIATLNTAGLYVTSQATITDPPRITSLDTLYATALAATALLMTLQTAFLTAPAFAVGYHKRRRELAEIAAQGGTPAHLRTIVLADGLFLGGAATITATALGIGTGTLTATLISPWTSQIGPTDIPWPAVLAAAALGLTAATAAALIPALRAARQNTATELAGRAPTIHRRRPSLTGAALTLTGLAATLTTQHQPHPAWVLTSALLLLIGLTTLTPWLIQLTARPAARLPLPLRTSIRDAARNPSRTTGAVAAVMAVTTTAIAIGITTHSTTTDHRDAHTSASPTGTLAIRAGNISNPTWTALRAETARLLPGVPLAAGYHAQDAQDRRYTLRYTTRWNGEPIRRTAAIGDQNLLTLLQGRHDPRTAAALAAGKAVVFDPTAVRDGELTLRASSPSGPPRTLHVPAVTATPADEHQGGALLPRTLVEQAGFTTTERGLYAQHRPPPDSPLWNGLTAISPRVTIAVEEGRPGIPAPNLWGWLAGALVLVVSGTLAATRLAAADLRPERATMLAIGAPPRTLRLVVAAQALYVSGLGTLMGLLAGTVTGVALSRPMTSHGPGDPVTIALPWPFLTAVVVGLPVITAAAALITRTRPPLHGVVEIGRNAGRISR